MRSKHRRWTILVVAVWSLALGLTTVLAPLPADATTYEKGWMVYTPNHPNGCAPLAFDCYVIRVVPD